MVENSVAACGDLHVPRTAGQIEGSANGLGRVVHKPARNQGQTVSLLWRDAISKRQILRTRAGAVINIDAHAGRIQQAVGAEDGIDQMLDLEYGGNFADDGTVACGHRVKRGAPQVHGRDDQKTGVHGLVLHQREQVGGRRLPAGAR